MKNSNTDMKCGVSCDDTVVKDEFVSEELMVNTEDDDSIEDVSLDIDKTEPQIRTVRDVSDEDLNTGNTPDEVIEKQSFNVTVKEELCSKEDNNDKYNGDIRTEEEHDKDNESKADDVTAAPTTSYKCGNFYECPVC